MYCIVYICIYIYIYIYLFICLIICLAPAARCGWRAPAPAYVVLYYIISYYNSMVL